MIDERPKFLCLQWFLNRPFLAFSDVTETHVESVTLVYPKQLFASHLAAYPAERKRFCSDDGRSENKTIINSSTEYMTALPKKRQLQTEERLTCWSPLQRI